MALNSIQSNFEELKVDDNPKEVIEQFYDFFNNIPFIQNLTKADRKRAKDLPRDAEDKIVVNITEPHILEDMDYFRPSAIHFQKYGCYTKLRPNPNPNSEYGKWIRTEIKRSWYGYVRPSDGEWVTGDYYYYLNYCPIQLIKKLPNGQSVRTVDFPRVWDGQYLVQHYLYNARLHGHHASELASRGKGKSFMGAGLLAKRFKLGESEGVNKKVMSAVTASDKKYIWGPNQILNMFKYYIDFQSQHTQFPRQLLTDSAQALMWESGFKDKETGVRKGTQNAVIGVTTGVNQDKLNGSRGVLYLIEEAGIFNNLNSLYQMIRPSVEDGKDVYGLIFMYGTAGDDMSDFTSLQEIMYNPDGYNMEKNPNVWDKEGQGRKWFTFFYPAYLNRANCMDENGNSNVTKALLEICQDRYIVKYNSTDINAITKRISQYPITPQEAIIRAHSTIFPITELNERLNQIDNNPNFYNDTYVGNLVFNGNGEVEFVISNDVPIRDFPTKDNKITGAIEIYALPEKDSNGKIPNERYIAGADPYDDDASNTMSLGSFFILDTWTDTIVMEYTGRPMFANDYFEICRKGCLFYNAKLMYEAHPYSQEVRLPNGETKLWKDVKVGDYLFAPDGNITKVIDIPMDGEDDIYRITLADGRQVEASSNHKWVVNKGNHKDKVYEVTTQEMYNAGIKNKHGQTNFFIPESGVVHYQYKEPIIDPYTLGLLIAEGALTKFKKNKYENFKRNYVQMSSSKEDMEIYKTLIPYSVKYIGTKGFSWHLYIEDIDLKLAELNLLHCNSHTKFIPSSYLVNAYEVRLQLLKGLMDGDGCATKSGAAVYMTTSEKLANDIALLCRSLGIKASISEPKKSVYRVTIISTVSVFNLPRKQKKQHVYVPYTKGSKASAYLYKTAIQNIEYIGRQKCKCITVDRADGLYLIGDYITTHNCNKKGLFAYFSMMNSSYLLAVTPEYLKDKQLIKDIGYGNKAFGINATTAIKGYGYQKIREWLLQPYTKIEKDAEGNDIEVQQANLYRLKNRALIKELILWNPDINVDRIMAMVQLVLYREEKMILYGGNMSSSGQDSGSELADDPFFKQNYDARYIQ